MIRSRVSVWIFAVAGSVALAVVAWTVARLVVVGEPSRATVAVPIHLSPSPRDDDARIRERSSIWDRAHIEATLAERASRPKPDWDRDHVSVPVELDPSLPARADAPHVRAERPQPGGRVPGMYGCFELGADVGVDIVDARGTDVTEDAIELRLRLQADGTYACDCLLTRMFEVGGRMIWYVPDGVSVRVRVNTFGWTPGETVVVAYDITSEEFEEPLRWASHFTR